jgi:hypothetical protein
MTDDQEARLRQQLKALSVDQPRCREEHPNLQLGVYTEQRLHDLMHEHDRLISVADDLKRRLAGMAELMHGILENGPWVLISDPALRDVVSRHLADALLDIAGEGKMPDVCAVAERLRGPGRLPTELPEQED